MYNGPPPRRTGRPDPQADRARLAKDVLININFPIVRPTR